MAKRLGDIIEDFTRDVLGIKKPCDGCKRRKEALNRAHEKAAQRFRGKKK